MQPIVDETNQAVSFDGGKRWTSYIKPDTLSNKTAVINALDELQRSISVRKVEISEICYHEKLPKPSFSDLDWMIEQIYWIKKTL